MERWNCRKNENDFLVCWWQGGLQARRNSAMSLVRVLANIIGMIILTFLALDRKFFLKSGKTALVKSNRNWCHEKSHDQQGFEPRPGSCCWTSSYCLNHQNSTKVPVSGWQFLVLLKMNMVKSSDDLKVQLMATCNWNTAKEMRNVWVQPGFLSDKKT